MLNVVLRHHDPRVDQDGCHRGVRTGPESRSLVRPGPARKPAAGERPRWPIRDAQEAMLFRYFILELAPLFDMCDDERHFARVVPCRAAGSPPLMNAMLAAAAKRLSRIRGLDRLVVDHYHQKCLDVLIPALSSSAAVLDENLLPAIVILRFVEELDVPIATAASPEPHLIGTRVFVSAQGDLRGMTALWRAAFWLALRQEIHMALVQARPVHSTFALEHAAARLGVRRDGDAGCGFANLLIVQCALCVRYCYGPAPRTAAAWDGLREAQDALWAGRPWMFEPLHEGDDDGGETFSGRLPVRHYLNDAVVTGVQNFHLTKILMAAHDPRAPRLGPGQSLAAQETNLEIKRIVRLTAPAYVNACIAITMAGDRFADRHEQELFYRILVKTDAELAWPTHLAQERMKEAWRWSGSSPRPAMSIQGVLNGDGRLDLPADLAMET
ncbi:hypothetical protein CDD83_9158 [Cordyceps sp. RAO-2017]|nr:hypothetical protein CDD83_9158 [Cordyceps sp. RAO-2017]